MTALLRTEGLACHFGGVRAVDGVDFELLPGEVHSIIGPNGAGKSTFFNLVTGVLRPTAGRIYFQGRDITGWAPSRIASMGMIRTFQKSSVFEDLTVGENACCALFVKQGGRRFRGFTRDLWRRAEQLLQPVGLEGQIDEPARTLAHGDKKKLELCLAVAQEPSLLLLDEPTAGMSINETQATGQIIKRFAMGRTVVVVEHDMPFVKEISGRITVLHRGGILAQGSVADIERNEQVHAVYLGSGGFDA